MPKRKTRTARRQARRAKVQKVERISPPPEAAQHFKSWPFMALLHRGPDAGGIDADELEAGIELVEIFKALTAKQQTHGVILGETFGAAHAGGNYGGLSDRAASLVVVWFAWAREIGSVATHLVEQIEDAAPIRSVEVLRHGLRRWIKIKGDYHRNPQQVVDSNLSSLTLFGGREVSGGPGPGKPHALPISHSPTPVRAQPRPSAGRAHTQAAHRSVTPKR